jgi:DDE superfamily endonuclease
VVRDYVVETLAGPNAVLVVDETGVLKQGKASCGVGRSWGLLTTRRAPGTAGTGTSRW